MINYDSNSYNNNDDDMIMANDNDDERISGDSNNCAQYLHWGQVHGKEK